MLPLDGEERTPIIPDDVTIKGRKPIGAISYYGCESCPTPLDFTNIHLVGFDGVRSNYLLTDEGALFFFRDRQAEGIEKNGIRLTREVGRIPCPDSRFAEYGDHVLYDWEFIHDLPDGVLRFHCWLSRAIWQLESGRVEGMFFGEIEEAHGYAGDWNELIHEKGPWWRFVSWDEAVRWAASIESDAHLFDNWTYVQGSEVALVRIP